MTNSPILTALAATPLLHPTRQTTGYRLDKGGTNFGPDIRPFYDFDRCELLEGRAQALGFIEHFSGPNNEEEAVWPEQRVTALLAFSKQHSSLSCELEFARRLMAWYVGCSGRPGITLRAVRFVLSAINSMGYRRALDDALIVSGIGRGIRQHPEVYMQILALSDLFKNYLRRLLEKYHEKYEWKMAADILEACCAGGDDSVAQTIEHLLERYHSGKTGRHSGRHHDRLDEQRLWTAAEVGYLSEALKILKKECVVI